MHTGISPIVAGIGIKQNLFHPGRLSAEATNAWRAKLGLAIDAPIILHVGRLDRIKQVDVVIHAAALAMKNNVPELLVIGAGTEKNNLGILTAELGISGRTHFPGFIRPEEGLAEIYRMATVFVTASEIETQGLVLLEAAASGCPIIAFRATYIPEIVQDGINGYLAAPRDVKGLAACLQRLLDNPEHVHALG